jgi:hypothetical protein
MIRLNKGIEKIYKELKNVEGIGVVIKDLDLKLVVHNKNIFMLEDNDLGVEESNIQKIKINLVVQ